MLTPPNPHEVAVSRDAEARREAPSGSARDHDGGASAGSRHVLQGGRRRGSRWWWRRWRETRWCRDVTVEAGVRRHRGRWRRRLRRAAGSARSERGIGVDDLVGGDRRHQVRVERGLRQDVEVEQPQCRAQVLSAELSGFGCGDVRDAADGPAEELHGVGEVGEDERADCARQIRVEDVVRVGERGGRDVKDVLDVHSVIRQHLRRVRESLHLLGGLVPGVRDEALHFADRDGELFHRGVEIASAVVQHGAEGRQPVLEQHDVVTAVAQRGDEGLEVTDGGNDVTAAVGEYACQLRQLSEGLTQFLTVAGHRVGGGVDEPAHRSSSTAWCPGRVRLPAWTIAP